MTPPTEPLPNWSVHASLSVRFQGRETHLTASGQNVIVEVPNLATGWTLFRSALPWRPGFRNIADGLVRLGCRVQLRIRRHVILEIGRRRFGILPALGWRHVRFHPLRLALSWIV